MTRTAAPRAGRIAVGAVVAALTMAGCSAATPAASTVPGTAPPAPQPATSAPQTPAPQTPASQTPAPGATNGTRGPTYSDVYQVGSCLRLTGDTKYLVPPVPCAQEHEEEVFRFIEFPEGGLLEGDALQKFLRTECGDAFTQYVGMGERESKYGYYAATPGKGGYARGIREGMCLAFADIHDIRDIPVITGSVKGTHE